jgi:hypothetical protein
VLVDLCVEQRHDVLPRFDERIGHGLAPPSCVDACTRPDAQFIGFTPIAPPLPRG